MRVGREKGWDGGQGKNERWKERKVRRVGIKRIWTKAYGRFEKVDCWKVSNAVGRERGSVIGKEGTGNLNKMEREGKPMEGKERGKLCQR